MAKITREARLASSAAKSSSSEPSAPSTAVTSEKPADPIASASSTEPAITIGRSPARPAPLKSPRGAPLAAVKKCSPP
jgi:hypothetical protein